MWKNRHESVGMASTSSWWQTGQRSRERNTVAIMAEIYAMDRMRLRG